MHCCHLFFLLILGVAMADEGAVEFLHDEEEFVEVAVTEDPTEKAEIQENDATLSDTLNQLIVAVGPVDVNPDRTFTNLLDFVPEGRGKITKLGKQQAYRLGQFIKRRYGDFLPSQHDDSFVSLKSSSGTVCQARMQALMAGVMVPKGVAVWDDDLAWQPTPYETNDKITDVWGYECPNHSGIKNLVNEEDTPFAQTVVAEHKKYIDYVAHSLGWEGNLATMDAAAHNLLKMHQLNLTYPTWVLNHPFNSTVLALEIAKFESVHDLLCAENDECRNAIAGPWFRDISTTLFLSSQGKGRKLTAYTTPPRTLLAVLWSLGLELPRLSPGSALLIEYRYNPFHSIRFVYSELIDPARPNGPRRNRAVILPGCNEEWCFVETIMSIAKGLEVTDFESHCGNTGCDDPRRLNDEGSAVTITIDCVTEEDQSGTFHCEKWASQSYCDKYTTVRTFYCRKTCMCNAQYRQEIQRR